MKFLKFGIKFIIIVTILILPSYGKHLNGDKDNSEDQEATNSTRNVTENSGVLYLLHANSNVTASELWMSSLYNYYSDVYNHKRHIADIINQGFDFRSPLLDQWEFLNVSEISLLLLNTQGDELDSYNFNGYGKNLTDWFQANASEKDILKYSFNGSYRFDFSVTNLTDSRVVNFATLSTRSMSNGSSFFVSKDTNSSVRLQMKGYEGCYYSSSYGISSVVQTVEECIFQCYYEENPYSALEDGSSCVCLSSLPTTSVASTFCNSNCSADSLQECGGQGYQSIYKTAESILVLENYTVGETMTNLTVYGTANKVNLTSQSSNESVYVIGLEIVSSVNLTGGFNLLYSNDHCLDNGITFSTYRNSTGHAENFHQGQTRYNLTTLSVKCLQIDFLNSADSVDLNLYIHTAPALFAPVLAITAKWNYNICQDTEIISNNTITPDSKIHGWYGTAGTADPYNGWIVPVNTVPFPDPMLLIVYPNLYPVKVWNISITGNAETVNAGITGDCEYQGGSSNVSQSNTSVTGNIVITFNTLPCADKIKLTLTQPVSNALTYNVKVTIYGCVVDVLGQCIDYVELLHQLPTYLIVEYYSRVLPTNWSIRQGGNGLQLNSFYSTDGPIITIILPPDYVDSFLVKSINITSDESDFSILYLGSRQNTTLVELATEINSCGLASAFSVPTDVYAIQIISSRKVESTKLFNFNVLVKACVLTENFLRGISLEYNATCEDNVTVTTEATEATSINGSYTQLLTTSDACCACSECPTSVSTTTPVPITQEEAEKKAEELRKELQVDVKTLSSTIRKKISVKDERPSSQFVGALGVVFLSVVFGGIILLDAPNLMMIVRKIWKLKLKNCK